MTIAEYAEKAQRKARSTRKECSTCVNMPSCWYKDQEGFMFDAVKDCWEPRQVPIYINNPIEK